MTPLYFCSGASAPADLRGLARIRHPLGVSIPQLSGPALDYVCELRGVCPVFVDTEAFSEVDREGRVVAPITDDAWIDRTRAMYRIAAALGDGCLTAWQDFIEGRPSPVATCGTTEDGCRRPTAEELEKARETAIVRAFGPELFLARAMAAYRGAGLVATREAPLQPGLFDEIRGKGVTRAG